MRSYLEFYNDNTRKMNESILSTTTVNDLPPEVIGHNVTQAHGGDAQMKTVLEHFTLPLICLIGLIGNTLSFYVFVQDAYRRSSCSVFLAVRCVSDNGFLLSLVLVWTSMTFDLQFSSVFIVCHGIIFLTYVCGCTSVWLVVFVTVENYIRIAKPHLVGKLCKIETARVVVIMLLIFVLCFYSFPFWTMDSQCGYDDSYNSVSIVRFMAYMDTFLTLIIPSTIMTILMVLIILQVVQSRGRRQRLSTTSFTSVPRARHPITKVTKLLLAVTLTYFILSLPSHVVRIRLLIKTMIKDDDNIGKRDVTWQTISLQIYYLSLTLNVFVYYIFGSKFRSVLTKTILNSGKSGISNCDPSSTAISSNKRSK